MDLRGTLLEINCKVYYLRIWSSELIIANHVHARREVLKFANLSSIKFQIYCHLDRMGALGVGHLCLEMS